MAADLPGAMVRDGRFNVVLMSIAVLMSNAAVLSFVNEFVRGARRDGLIAQAITRAGLLAQAITRAGLRGVRPAP